MQIGELFNLTNYALKETDFFKASSVKTKEDAEHYSSRLNRTIVTFDEIKSLCEKVGINPEHVYFSEKVLSVYFYYDFPILIDFFGMTEEDMNFLQIKKRIQTQSTYFNKALKENDFSGLFAHMDNRIWFLALEKLFNEVPDEKKYELFKEVYILSEYGFSDIPPEIVEDAFNNQTTSYKEKVQNSLNDVTNDNVLTIYRGVGEKSIVPEHAFSWTLNFNTAVFFSNRFDDMKGEIYSAKVRKQDVIDYITNRNESEIIVRPNDVYDIEAFGMKHSDKVIQALTDSYAIYDFHEFVNFMDKSLFHNPDGIHGYLHMKRVFLHTIVLAEAFELDDFDRKILYLSALYHDIGRTHDEVDDEHGLKSWQKMTDLNLLEEIQEHFEIYDYDFEIIRFIIENHCLSDDIIEEKLDNFEIGGYSTDDIKTLINIFKDADGLDRVRLGDLNVSYLRNEEAKKLVLFAHEILKGIK